MSPPEGKRLHMGRAHCQDLIRAKDQIPVGAEQFKTHLWQLWIRNHSTQGGKEWFPALVPNPCKTRFYHSNTSPP